MSFFDEWYSYPLMAFGGVILMFVGVGAVIYAGDYFMSGIHKGTGVYIGYVTSVGESFENPRVYMKTELESSDESCYDITNKELIPLLEGSMLNKTRIKIIYETRMSSGPWHCSNTRVNSAELI